MLVPGVNSGPGGVISQFGGFSVNGARAQSNNYMLDGGDNNDHQGGAPMIVPNPDSLEEFSIQTQNFSAEHGGAMGGVINAVTKSGTNEFHGSAFDFLRNDVLDASSFDANRSGADKASSVATSSEARWAARSSGTGASSSTPSRAHGPARPRPSYTTSPPTSSEEPTSRGLEIRRSTPIPASGFLTTSFRSPGGTMSRRTISRP